MNILVLCTGNSARSILGEAALMQYAPSNVYAFSAGSHPTGRVNPFALEVLQQAGLATHQFRSKSWDEFAQADAPPIDLLITVCDNAAGEICPLFNQQGEQPVKAHWGYPDPAAVLGSDDEKRAAFQAVFTGLCAQAAQLLALPLMSLNRTQLAQAAQAIGQGHGTKK